MGALDIVVVYRFVYSRVGQILLYFLQSHNAIYIKIPDPNNFERETRPNVTNCALNRVEARVIFLVRTELSKNYVFYTPFFSFNETKMYRSLIYILDSE